LIVKQVLENKIFLCVDQKEKSQISRGDFLFKNERNFCGGFLLFSMKAERR
jgi:hypothetical protein